MANLKLRFTIFAKEIIAGLNEKAKELPSFSLKSVEIITEGLNEGSSIDYVYLFEDITSTREASDFFINEWKDHTNSVKAIFNHLNSAYLLFEFDMDEDNVYPELTFEPKFLSFLEKLNAELQLYFYPM